MKKDVLKNFVRFTGKHLCRSLFFYLVLRPAPFLKRDSSKKLDVTGRREVGVSECSGRPIFIFIFLLKEILFAP